MAGQKKDKDRAAIEEAIQRVLVEQPKATLRSLKDISAEYDGIPTNLTDENGNINYQLVAEMLAKAARRLGGSDVTTDNVLDIVDLDTVMDGLSAVTAFLTIRIPDGLVPPEMLSDASTEGQDEPKNLP